MSALSCDSNLEITFDLHVSLSSRKKYQIEQSLFSLKGDLIIADFNQARILAQKINDVRKSEGITDNFVTAGQINALGLLHEIFHFIIRHYEVKENPGVFERNIKYIKKILGNAKLNSTLKSFIEQFPPLDVFKGKVTTDQYLQGSTGVKPNTEIIIEEIILLHLENINKAFINLKELYNDEDLIAKTHYKEIIGLIEKHLETEKTLSFENLPLLASLRKPILLDPHNIEAQLSYIRNNWGGIIDEKFLTRILSSADLIREDVKLFIHHGGVGTPPVPSYDLNLSKEELAKLKQSIASGKIELIEDVSLSYHLEPERFTDDTDWMPRVVMIAKNAFVWLDQLSKKYYRDIKRLDQIPDEELDRLRDWNFSSLWLIGLWERSSASQKIKQFCGNHDAAPSAYSLYDYVIANELGGEGAFQNLKHRCWIRGIRLASDMVPNHTGIFSKWILENPDYFIQLDYPPYPNYSFTGPDLSDDHSIQIRIEDKYYSKQDAAVVFQLIDNRNGQIRYIYHGNDGTNMPWNDTAQLNLLKPEARESLIQTIMHVARKTSIIRFDAAMTLAKKHYSRLWFPQPGTGGAIPSRSDHAMHRSVFDSVMPNEFWREVVDRINAEMPNTLLLAEAFWLMEGYFVRTLGMHRVYNSAFMHMFMKEENQKYRELIKNTIEYNPEILKRYVNFMSNPDEETAINQFGKGDKYIGVTVMMITLPGLPMFAHGQIEGFTEKYGMEYKRAYYSEIQDDYLIKRHEEEIFPLLKFRKIFSQVENFEFFDFVTESGEVNENVFAFTNRFDDKKVLVFYNNSYFQTAGKVSVSTGKVVRGSEGVENSPLIEKSLAQALRLNSGDNIYYIVKDNKRKLEYLKSSNELFNHGYWVSLGGYQYNVFTEFIEKRDVTGEYLRLYNYLNGKGVHSVEKALKELNLMPLHIAITDLFNKSNVVFLRNKFIDKKTQEQITGDELMLSPYLRGKVTTALLQIESLKNITIEKDIVLNLLEEDLEILNKLVRLIISNGEEKEKTTIDISSYFILNKSEQGAEYLDILIMYLVVKRLLAAIQFIDKSETPAQLYDSLMFQKPIWQALIRLGDNYSFVKKEVDLLKILASTEGIFPLADSVIAESPDKKTKKFVTPVSSIHQTALQQLIGKAEVESFIQVNEYNGTKYFNKEYFETLLNWNFTLAVIRLCEKEVRALKEKRSINSIFTSKKFTSSIKGMIKFIDTLLAASSQSQYHYDVLKSLIKKIYLSQVDKLNGSTQTNKPKGKI